MKKTKKPIIPVTEAEVKQWMAECDAGLHPLTPEDAAALETGRARFMEQLRAMSWQQSFAE